MSKKIGTIEYTVYLGRNDMNEWKELKIDDLPSDILVGDYEWMISQGYGWEGARAEENPAFRVKALEELQAKKKCMDKAFEKEVTVKYRYRKRKPKAPTHQEIMTKWWKSDCGYLWHKVFWYKPNTKQYYIDGIVCSIKWFTGRESADIPPEAE